MIPVVRAGIALLLLLAIANGLFLYFFPARAEEDYAWAIAPPVSAAFMGAGYLAGVVATGLAVFAARSWSSVRAVVPGFCALGAIAFGATLAHTDKFRWDYAPTWVWTAVYATLPLGAVALVWLQRSRGPDEPSPKERWGGAAVPLAYLLGTLGLAAALLLVVAPQWLLDDWPWKLTPLLARVFGAWYALAGLVLLGTGWIARRPADFVIPLLTVGSWCLLVLLLPLLYPDQVAEGGILPALIAFHGALLCYCGVVTVLGARAAHAAGDRL